MACTVVLVERREVRRLEVPTTGSRLATPAPDLQVPREMHAPGGSTTTVWLKMFRLFLNRVPSYEWHQQSPKLRRAIATEIVSIVQRQNPEHRIQGTLAIREAWSVEHTGSSNASVRGGRQAFAECGRPFVASIAVSVEARLGRRGRWALVLALGSGPWALASRRHFQEGVLSF